MLPVAPAGTGQPPSSPKLDSNELHARLERRVDVGQPLAARVVEVGGQLDVGQPVERALEERADLRRVRHPGGVAEADLLGAGGGEPPADREHRLGIDDSLVRAAERDADHRLAAQPVLAGARHDPLEAGQRLRRRRG